MLDYANCYGFEQYYYPSFRAAGDVAPPPAVSAGWPKLLFAAGLFGAMSWLYASEVKLQHPNRK